LYLPSVAKSSVQEVIPEAVAVEYSFNDQPIPLGAGIPVQLDRLPLAGVPRAGVTSVGELANTKAPVPVSSVTALARLAELGVARKVPTPVPSPVIEPTAGVTVVLHAAVMSPFPFTVKVPAAVALPKEPTLLLTVARVVAFVFPAVQSNELPALVTSPVSVPIVLDVCSAVAVPVIEPAIALVTSKSVNQPFVTRVAVAPIVVTKRLAHFLRVVPKSSVLSVSETRVVLIATLARLSRAVVAPELLIVASSKSVSPAFTLITLRAFPV